jgi:hypothetical protein
VHLVAGCSDIGDAIRQLCLRHRQRVEHFAQQLDLTSFCDQVPGEQLMERSPGRGGTTQTERTNVVLPPYEAATDCEWMGRFPRDPILMCS